MRFGDIAVAAGGGPFTRKPRPVVIVQNADHSTGSTVVVAPLTRTPNADIPYRVEITPSRSNGLREICFAEIDKLGAINRSFISKNIGHLDDAQVQAVLKHIKTLLAPGSPPTGE